MLKSQSWSPGSHLRRANAGVNRTEFTLLYLLAQHLGQVVSRGI